MGGAGFLQAMYLHSSWWDIERGYCITEAGSRHDHLSKLEHCQDQRQTCLVGLLSTHWSQLGRISSSFEAHMRWSERFNFEFDVLTALLFPAPLE